MRKADCKYKVFIVMKSFQKNKIEIVQIDYIITIESGYNMEKLLITPKNLKVKQENVKITLKK
jgi:hypothetical protein